MARRLGLWLLAVGAVAVLVAAASASPQSKSTRGGTLRLMWGAAPDSVDPALASGRIGSWALLRATCATLFTTVLDPDTGKQRVVREVVRSSTVSNGGRTYTFELKRTYRFDTGAPVTARSFALAFDRDANPRMRSPVARQGFLQDIVGAEAVIQGTATTISGVQVLDRYRLRIRLNRPAGDFRARMTMPYFCPIMLATPFREIVKPPGSGPYSIRVHIPNRRIVLERNPYYRGARPANPDRIVWTITDATDYLERLEATEQGENDYVSLVSMPDAVVRGLIETYGVDRPGGRVIRDYPTPSSFGFLFNPHRRAFEGFGQAPLRKAINYALDRPALVRAHPYLTVRRSDRLLPAELSNRRPFYPLGGPNLVAAQRWLARTRKSPRTLHLYTWTFPVWPVRAAQVFALNLKPLGIEVKVHHFDLALLFKKLAAPGEPWDVAWRPLGAAYPDPAGALIPLLRGTRHEARLNAVNRLTGSARAKAWTALEADLMLNDPPVAAYAHFTPLAFVSRSNFDCWSGADAHLDLGAVCKR
jgi:Bacterial extracellular solute-binding proteins, family 5 Middle